MRKMSTIIIVLTIAFNVHVLISEDYWESIGPNGGGIAVVESHPSDSTLIFCASKYGGGFYVSFDKGVHWEARRKNLKGFNCWCIGVHPIYRDIIYIGGHSLFKTTDLGLTWTEKMNGLGGHNQIIYSIVPDEAGDTLVYAGTYLGLFKSTNGGENWHQTSLDSWTWDIEIDFSNPLILYAATKNGMYMSTDGGESWEMKTDSLEITTFFSVEQNPSDSMKLYIAGRGSEFGKIYKTIDRCENWTDITDSLNTYYIYDLAVDSDDSEELYACVNSRGIYKSIDGGISWFRSSEGIEYFEMENVCIIEKKPEIIFTSDGFRGGVYRSTNKGGSWQKSNSGIHLTKVTDIEFVDEEKENLLCGSLVDGLSKYYSADMRWESVEIPCDEINIYSYTPVNDIAVDDSNDAIIYIAADCGVLQSIDAGQNWTNLYPYPTGMDNSALRILLHPLNSNYIACMTYENSVATFILSSDGGVDWTIKYQDFAFGLVTDLLCDPTSLSTYYFLPGESGFYKTTDSGETWDFYNVVNGLNFVTSMIIDPQNSDHQFVTLQGEAEDGIYLSDDGGDSWEIFWQVDSPYKLAMDPTNSLILYCWCSTGPPIGPSIFKSNNGGYNWEEITSNVAEYTNDYSALTMKIHSVSTNELYVGTSDAGILVLDQSQVTIEGDLQQKSPLSKEHSLHQNYPNPFNPVTTIKFEVPADVTSQCRIELTIYDSRGRLVRTLINSNLKTGTYQVIWDGTNDRGEVVSSGVYFYTIKTGDYTATRKMTVVR